MKTITLIEKTHRGQEVYLLCFPKNQELISLAKSIGCTFSKTHKGWWLKKTAVNLKLIQQTFEEKVILSKELNSNSYNPSSLAKDRKTRSEDLLTSEHL